ncbi:hypothetical protein LP7551_03262 [Roseibium album]|nr:hypothetical protein LP7551_03262 [Roseibium album]
MTGSGSKKGMKSLGGNKPMRSRGFLSQPVGQAPAAEGVRPTSPDEKNHHRSRGARQNSPSKDGQPQNLETRPHIKPYTLEDK